MKNYKTRNWKKKEKTKLINKNQMDIAQTGKAKGYKKQMNVNYLWI